MMKLFVQILCLLLIFDISKSEIPTSAGTEFVVCFPRNNQSDYKEQKSLYLFAISLNGDTVHGKIMNSIVEPYLIKFEINYDSIAMIKIPDILEIDSFIENQQKALVVTTDSPIYLFGLTTKYMTSDAMLCLPVSTLDTSYVVSSNWNTFHSMGNYPGLKIGNNFSNFTLVGIDDSTLVKIIPTCPVYSPKNTSQKEFTININKGETRQIIADVTLENDTSGTNNYDLSGSIISSNKKIGVFSGHHRAEVTSGKPGISDILLESTPPISIMDVETILTPVYSSGSKFVTYAKIVPYFDSTSIIFADTTILLRRFSTYYFNFDTAIYIRANKPFLSAIYAPSVINPSDWLNGDPFLVFPAPPRQFLNQYKIISIPLPNFREHFFSITIHKEGINSLILDKKNIPDSLFKAVTGTDYSWAVIPVSAGSHKIKSDSSFGLLVYGNGFYDSYGYNGGMKTERLLESIIDENPPQIKSSGNCNPVIKITEDKSFDTGIDVIEIIKENNVNTEIPEFKKGSFSVNIKAELIDKFQDGELILKANDKKGQYSFDTLLVKGMTISTNKSQASPTANIGHIVIDSLQLENFGLSNQVISAYCANNVFVSIPQSRLPLQLQPGEKTSLPIVFGSYSLSEIKDTIILVDECGRNIKIPIRFESVQNEYNTEADCGVSVVFTSSETDRIFVIDNTIYANGYKGKIEIYNIVGAIVESFDISENQNLNLANLSSGVYLIKTGNMILKHYKY